MPSAVSYNEDVRGEQLRCAQSIPTGSLDHGPPTPVVSPGKALAPYTDEADGRILRGMPALADSPLDDRVTGDATNRLRRPR
jgi:hypothetical protein